MTIPTGTFNTYDAIGNREDLSDMIWDISPIDTPVTSMIPKVKASGIKHEWQTDALTAAATNSNIDGDDASNDSVTATVRPFNYTQILDKVNQVSGTQDAVSHAGRASELDYQKARRLRELKRDLEFVVCQQTTIPTVGTDTAARIMGGLIPWIRNNTNHVGTIPVFTAGTPTTTRVDGTQRAFTESQFKDALALQYAAGGKASKVVLGPFNKQVFSTFSGGATRFDTAEDAVLNASVDVYRSDFGTLQIIPSRFVRTRDCFILDPELLGLAELRPVFSQELAITGDSRRFQILMEATLEVRNEKGLAAVYDLTTS